jgi:uncharacterized protein YhaN
VRLESIDLIRFGHFCGRKIEFPVRQPDYYVIYGDNEAGKSTLLRSISALFFGVPVKTPDVHSCKGSELRIEATISEGQKRFSFRRRKGSSGTLLNLNDGQIPDNSLDPFLRELDRERFEQFFGLTHERLREGGQELLRGEGEVGSALFQAAGLLELRRLLDQLDSGAKEIFSPKSRTRTIGRVLEEYRTAKAEIGRLAISGAAVKQKQTELESAKETLAKLKRESHALQQELVRLRRIESNKPDLARLNDMRTELASLENVPTLPPDARRQFDDATAALANANSQIDILIREIAEREKRIQTLPGNRLFKAHEDEIKELNEATGDYTRSVADRPKRMRARDQALEQAQNAWAEVWSQPVGEAENLKNVYSSKEEILKLVADHNGLTAELASAEEELRNVTQEQQRLQEQLAQHLELADPAGLLAAVEQAKSLGDTDQLVARLRSDAEGLAKNAQRQMRKLAQWQGTLEELENFKTPLLATIEQYGREWESLAGRCKDLFILHANHIEVIRQKEGELANLSAQVSEAGESELSAARSRRDQIWDLIRGSVFDKTITPEEAQRRLGSSGSLAEAFSGYLQKADEIADVRFANARDAALHDRVVKEIAAGRAEQRRIEEEINRLERAQGDLRARWSSEWSGMDSPPLSPAEMKEWIQARESILVQFEQARMREEELQSLQERTAVAAAQIMGKWAVLEPGIAPGTESLPILIRMAEAFAKERENARQARDQIFRQLRSLSIEKRRAKLEDCNQRLLDWSRKWAPYVSALLLPAGSTTHPVSRALVVLEAVFHQLNKAKELDYRVTTIGDNIEAFEKRVSQVVVSLDESLSLLAPDVAVKQLHSQLVELGNAETERETLEKQNEKDRKTMAVCREKAQKATASLEKLKALAHCKDAGEQQLEAAILDAEHKAELQQEQKRISAGLIERNAVADLEQIEQEASTYDLDSLQSEIAAKDECNRNSVDEISRAASQYGELLNEFERLENREESALQAQRAEDALAQLRPAVAQYLRLRLAAEILQRAIESYREKHQGPILTAASELFSRLTAGRHSGLTSDFGDDDKPVLVAIRENGERVYVDGLSDGTRDQLYLALRLAAIEHHVKNVVPCPVIFDDLLINSDDTRAAATLRVIGEIARHTQVLFFTHHRRLAELAAGAGAQMIELGSLAAPAVA